MGLSMGLSMRSYGCVAYVLVLVSYVCIGFLYGFFFITVDRFFLFFYSPLFICLGLSVFWGGGGFSVVSGVLLFWGEFIYNGVCYILALKHFFG
jgi:hypothetical protein